MWAKQGTSSHSAQVKAGQRHSPRTTRHVVVKQCDSTFEEFEGGEEVEVVDMYEGKRLEENVMADGGSDDNEEDTEPGSESGEEKPKIVTCGKCRC